MLVPHTYFQQQIIAPHYRTVGKAKKFHVFFCLNYNFTKLSKNGIEFQEEWWIGCF